MCFEHLKKLNKITISKRDFAFFVVGSLITVLVIWAGMSNL